MWKNGFLITALLGLLVACGRDEAPPAPTTDPSAPAATGQAAPPASPAPPPATATTTAPATPQATGAVPAGDTTAPAPADPQAATGAGNPAPAPAGGATATETAGGGLALGEQVYKKTCVTCHGGGLAGAPKLGEPEVWAPRIAQGMDVLYQHSIEGFTGSTGMMPPKGANPALSDDEVRAAVDYMVSQAP